MCKAIKKISNTLLFQVTAFVFIVIFLLVLAVMLASLFDIEIYDRFITLVQQHWRSLTGIVIVIIIVGTLLAID